jgi:uncharacterized protein YhbP (UPF0306 family)
MGDRVRKATVRKFLETQSTLVLSTVNEQGVPHATPLFYVQGEDLALYWLSMRSSEHSKNILRAPAVSASVHRSTFAWREIAGVQMQGIAAIAETREKDVMLRKYRDRFRLGRTFSAAIAASSLFVFRPTWVRYLDNAKRLAYKFEFSID